MKKVIIVGHGVNSVGLAYARMWNDSNGNVIINDMAPEPIDPKKDTSIRENPQQIIQEHESRRERRAKERKSQKLKRKYR